MKNKKNFKTLISTILFFIPGLTADSVTFESMSLEIWAIVTIICFSLVLIINRKEIDHAAKTSH